MNDPLCPLCNRPIPAEARSSLHHLTPRLRGGKGGSTVLLHQLCHDAIHSSLTETDIARRFASIEKLRQHPEVARFVEWVRKRPPDFYSPFPGPRRRS